MTKPRDNEKECAICHRFIPKFTKGNLCPECKDREDSNPKVTKLYVECENCGRPVKNGDAFYHGKLVCCGLSCKRELEKLVELR